MTARGEWDNNINLFCPLNHLCHQWDGMGQYGRNGCNFSNSMFVDTRRPTCPLPIEIVFANLEGREKQ